MRLSASAAQLAESLTRLCGGFRVDQIGDGLGLSQVHAPVLEGAPGELSRFSGGQTERQQGLRHRLDHRPAAMQMQLGAVFTGVGVGRREAEHQGFVENDLVPRETTQRRHARFQPVRAQGLKRVRRGGA